MGGKRALCLLRPDRWRSIETKYIIHIGTLSPCFVGGIMYRRRPSQAAFSLFQEFSRHRGSNRVKKKRTSPLTTRPSRLCCWHEDRAAAAACDALFCLTSSSISSYNITSLRSDLVPVKEGRCHLSLCKHLGRSIRKRVLSFLFLFDFFFVPSAQRERHRSVDLYMYIDTTSSTPFSLSLTSSPSYYWDGPERFPINSAWPLHPFFLQGSTRKSGSRLISTLDHPHNCFQFSKFDCYTRKRHRTVLKRADSLRVI